MTTKHKRDLKRHSKVVTDGPDRAPARSMLRAVGLQDEDMEKPFVAIGNLQVTSHLVTYIWIDLPKRLKKELEKLTVFHLCLALSQ